MPDLKQALKDFVATSNSGKYPDEATLLSKFPELKGYDINVLKDFVATSNSGKYKTEDELFAKFPEFGVSGQESPLKKKEEPIPPMAPQPQQAPSAIPGAQPYTESPLEDTSSVSQSSQSNAIPVRPTDVPVVNQQEDQTPFGVFNQKITGALTPEEQARSVKIQQPVVKEQPEQKVDADYFTGAFSDVLKGFDKISPIGIGDFIDDMARSVASGYRQGTAAQEADNLLLQGTKATPEQIQKFIDANKNAQLLGPSQEMVDYQKIYEEEGKGFWGVIKGLINNPSVIPEIISSSLVAMATNTDALKAGAAAIVAGAGIGAAGGTAVVPVAGTAAGALAGAQASIPYAFGLASSVVEMGSTFGELLTDELNGKEMTKENVKAILENPEKLQSIRNKAIARGAIIGTVDAFTGKLASGVGAKIIGKSAAKSATGAVTKGAITRATAAGAGIEAVGGSAGEAAARGAIGQEMNVSDIALEGIADLPGGIRSTLQARLAKPSYKVNGAKATAEQVDELINTMTPDELQKTKIDIKNDYQGREFKIQDKIVTNSVKEQVRQGNPDLNEPSLNAITDLELQLRKLEGNTTQTGKDKAAAIRTQIKGIQENQIQEEAKVATIEAEAPEITEIPESISSLKDDEQISFSVNSLDEIPEQFKDRAVKKDGMQVEIREKIFGLPIGKKTSMVVNDGYRYTLTGKEAKDYAIQKQSTNEGVLRTGQPELGLQEVGKGNVQPEVTTTGTEEAIAKQPEQEEVKFEELKNQVNNSKDISEFLRNIITDYDTRYKNRKAAEPLVTNVSVAEIDKIKGNQKVEKETVDFWKNEIESGKKPFIIVTENNIDGHHKLQAYKDLGIENVPVLYKKDLINFYNNTKSEASLKIEPIISESELPGYDRMIQQVDGIIEKSKDRAVPNEKVKENVMDYVAKSSVYEKATDVQREKLFREVNRMFGLKEVAAPSAAKILGNIKDVAKITMTEKQGLVKQIKDLARGGKDAKKAIYSAAQQLSKEVKELRKQGKLNTNQAANVVRKFSKVNVLSQKSINSFTDYMTKVFENADYIAKLATAKKLKQSISELSRNKDKNADLRELGRQFSEIDPSMVDDIEKYNEIAAQIKESIKGSTTRKGEINFAEIVNIKDVSNYIKEKIDAQNKKIKEERIDEIEDLMGVDASKFSAEEMLDLLNVDEKVKVNNEKSIKEKAKNAFKIYSSIVKNTIRTGVDAFTGEKVDFTKKQKELVNNFADMDLDLLDAKESVAAVDALTIFLQNHSTAKMEGVFADYTGRLNIKTLVKQGKVGIALRKLWSKPLARVLTEGGTPLPEVFTKIFKGVREGLYIATKSGFNKIVNGNALANTRIQNITKEYIDKFFKTKPNGEKFNTAYNDAERGIASDLMRSVIGTESEMQKEFNRRKSILKQSIEELSTGTDEQQQKGKIYQKVYDNIVKGSKNINDIEKKLDKTNLEAINFWIKTYDDIFPEISDYMLNVRNTLLEKNLNYSSPDRYVKLSKEKNKLLTDDQPMYGRDGEFLIKKEAGGLMKAEHPDDLPKGMYRDYSFDKNNVNSLRDVLVDMNTGAAIRQLDAFKNSKYFDKLMPNAEDRDLLKRRFALYVSNIRNAEYNGSEDLDGMMKFLDRLATLGVGMALGSPTQAIKQTIPIGVNTMVNASSLLKLGAAFNPDFNNFFYNTGYASANRGVESQAEISSLNKKIETASNKVELLKAIENANKWWLKTFLVKPDVFIARASWQTYYEQELKKQGIDTKNLDYSKHKLNEQAGDYAESMVSRQQNTPDSALSGSWFSKSGSDRKILAKIFLNMANFRMNQSSRLAADLSVLGHWGVSTTEDKAIAARSIAGYAVEQAIYRLISTGLAIGIGSIVLGMRGDDESEEDKKKRIDAIIKGQLTGSVMDILSPAPFLDVPVKEILSPTLEGIEKATGLPLSIYGNKKQDYSNLLGAYGIPIQRAEELYDAIKLGTTGTYTDEFGKEKQITEEDQKIISELIPLSVGTVLGLMPSDVATGVRDIIKFSKRKQTTDEEVEQKIENAENKQEDIDQKVEVLDKLKKKAKNQYEQEAIDEKIYELEADKEEKKLIKEANAEEKELKKELLTNPVTGEEYDNETALKKYNPRLYNKNFGVRSQWYKDHKYEKLVEKKMKAEIIKMEDEEHNYQKPEKTSSKKRNSDGSFKRSYYRKYSSESSR